MSAEKGYDTRNPTVYDVTNLSTLQYFADTASDIGEPIVTVRTETLLAVSEFAWSLLPEYLRPEAKE
jgi:hypothetical protein